ncbi:MAG: SDR family NAD(P)-dependent oxidoreductase, partial [Rhodobacteraceae bacterium]|nr:SDR family NAD(P)-dependent oxidoreductase [Paracoccaceae bacterium]
MGLEGKTALVTGGASGFGAGIARQFHAEGARVMIADIDAEAAEAMAAVLGTRHVTVDVGDDASVAAMAAAALAEFG